MGKNNDCCSYVTATITLTEVEPNGPSLYVIVNASALIYFMSVCLRHFVTSENSILC